jgi:hypothetical protein
VARDEEVTPNEDEHAAAPNARPFAFSLILFRRGAEGSAVSKVCRLLRSDRAQ